ncbi:Phenylacetone monooxygenase [Pirellulimonas nuda]|uniref:Phenylacetone monooxygenase n=1 Tax=Pirellulimonas nuda TaxID=2528009 RepID=A0A518D5X5_9BACT|nr:NAD(P)-binding domain-containing protein [Pirellulimonas nuda]QDU86876.1 Phenylacetone monooxygenase [Pirellulimonas nuda]
MKHHDYLVIGAGPAGLQLGYFLEKAGRDYLLLEGAPAAGSFFEKFPRHDMLISINKVHTGYNDRRSRLRYDWNSLICDDESFALTEYTEDYFPQAKLMVQYLRDFAQKYALNIQTEARVAQVCRRDDSPEGYVVTLASGEQITCRVLVMASGMAKPYVPDFPGAELTENYADMSVERRDYAGQRVLVLGKGNSGFETADHLVSHARAIHVCSPSPLKLAWKSHYVGNLRAVNNNFLDTYLLKGQNAVLDATVERVQKIDGQYVVDFAFTHANGQRCQMAYDRVLVCTGFRFDDSIYAQDCRPELSACGRRPMMTSAWESTNLPDLYFAGTLMQSRDYHKTMSNVMHGFRHNVQSLASILEERYEGRQWASDPLPLRTIEEGAQAMADKVIERVSSDAAMMLQPGFLGDVMVVGPQSVDYYPTANIDYIHESRFGQSDDYYVVTMEYGSSDCDMLAIERMPDATEGAGDVYQHPRIRRYCRGRLLAEHHIPESLENDWRPDRHAGDRPLVLGMGFPGIDPTRYRHVHRDELVAFFREQLSERSVRVAEAV